MRAYGAEQLSLRASDGTEPAGSFFLRRNVDASTPTLQNLEVSIGQPPSGGAVNRLLVAASNPGTPVTLAAPPALSVGTDARVGIGVAVPQTGLALDVKGDLGHDGDPTSLHLNGSVVGGAERRVVAHHGEQRHDRARRRRRADACRHRHEVAAGGHRARRAWRRNRGQQHQRVPAAARLRTDRPGRRNPAHSQRRQHVSFDGNDNVGVGTTHSPASRRTTSCPLSTGVARPLAIR